MTVNAILLEPQWRRLSCHDFQVRKTESTMVRDNEEDEKTMEERMRKMRRKKILFPAQTFFPWPIRFKQRLFFAFLGKEFFVEQNFQKPKLILLSTLLAPHLSSFPFFFFPFVIYNEIKWNDYFCQIFSSSLYLFSFILPSFPPFLSPLQPWASPLVFLHFFKFFASPSWLRPPDLSPLLLPLRPRLLLRLVALFLSRSLSRKLLQGGPWLPLGLGRLWWLAPFRGSPFIVLLVRRTLRLHLSSFLLLSSFSFPFLLSS